MGIGRPNDEIRTAMQRMDRDWETVAASQAIIEQFNSRLTAKKPVLFWPTVGAALICKHYWLVIACDSCDTTMDLDLTVKRRNSNAPINFAIGDVRCPRCNGHGRTRIAALARFPSI
jgi:hypothetical protein